MKFCSAFVYDKECCVGRVPYLPRSNEYADRVVDDAVAAWPSLLQYQVSRFTAV